MNRSNVHLLDLPDEILLMILKKLNNIDVLYSLLDVNNGRLNILAQENTFTNILKFPRRYTYSLIDRFCIDILPRIHHNVKCFIFHPFCMKRILLATDYPNLTELKIFHFKQGITLDYLTNVSSLRSSFQEQITNLTLINDDKDEMIHSLENYTTNDKLFNLKCFSLKSFFQFKQYDKILSLVRRMSNLEKLTLYLPIKGRNRVIDGTYVQHDILDYMPQLHSFIFYICTYVETVDLFYKLSNEDIQQTLTNIGQQHVTSIVNYIHSHRAACSIFSLPFQFDYLKNLGNKFPNIIFSYVTYLLVQDTDPFEHEFFMRIARSFPLLKHLRIFNVESQVLDGLITFSSDNCQLHSIIEYPHLTILDVQYAHRDYVEQFLNETNTFIPCLAEFEVSVNHLKAVTKDFTREETQRNCAKVKRIFPLGSLVYSKKFFLYFPSLYK
ncbi:unnamed protein product [Rotaria socialis]|uniref:F-box domain-containing protein n=1 Tax=Rotaria socialis TaxID=392032 RepID=A0A820U1B1_9BILA|nr:unnamed protein product [Rotaria socialis]